MLLIYYIMEPQEINSYIAPMHGGNIRVYFLRFHNIVNEQHGGFKALDFLNPTGEVLYRDLETSYRGRILL